MSNLLPKDQEEVTEWNRLQGEEKVLTELHELFELDEFDDFYKSPASLVLSPWLDKRTKEVRERLNELMGLIKQRYEL